MDDQTNQPFQKEADPKSPADPLPKKKMRKYFFWILLAVLLIGVVAIFLHILLNYPGFQRHLIHRLSRASPYDVETGKIRINYRDGLEIKVQDVLARSKNASHTIQAAQIDLKYKYNALLNGRFFPEKAIIQDGYIKFKTNKKMSGSIPTDRLTDFQTRLGSLIFDSHWVELNNITIINAENQYGLKNLNFRIIPPADNPQQREVRLNGLLTDGDTSAPFRLEGVVNHPSDSGGRPAVELDVQLRDVPLAHIPWPKQIQFNGGRASGDFHFTGPDNNRLNVTGNISGGGLNFNVNRKGRSKLYDLSQAKIDFDGHLGLTDGRIEKLSIWTPEAQIGLGLHLDWQHPSNPIMDLDIHSRPVPLPVFKKIFPTPLVPPWIEAKLFPLFSGGTARLDRLQLKGTIDAMKKLKRPENAEVFEMRLALDQMTALSTNPDLSVTDVNGEVIIHQGQLQINGVKGHFGKSTLTEGTILWPSLYDKSRQYTLGIRGDFYLEDLKRQGVQPVLPTVIRREIDRISSAQGPMMADIELAFPGKKQLPLLTGKIGLENSRIHHTALSLPIDLLNGRFHFDNKGTVHIDANGRWGVSDVVISGTTGRLWKEDGPVGQPHLNLDLNADIHLPNLLTLRRMAILPAPWRKPLAGIKTITGRMGTEVTLRRKAFNAPIRLTGILKTDRATLNHVALKLPLDIKSGNMKIDSSGNSRFSAAGAWGRSSFSAEGTANVRQKSALVSLSTRADINELMDRYYPHTQSLLQLDHSLPGQIRIQKTADRWSLAGEVDLDSQVVTLPALIIAPTDAGNRLIFDVDYSAGKWVLNSGQILGKKSHFNLKSAGTGGPGSRLTLDITAAPLNLADLGFKIKDGTGDYDRRLKGELRGQIKVEAPLGIPENTRVNGTLTVDGLQIGDTKSSSPYQINLRFKDRDIEILNLTFPLGEQKGQLKGRLTGWDRWRGQLDLDMDCIDLPRLIDKVQAATTGGATPLSGLLADAEINMGIHANQVIWETIDLGQFSAALQYQHDRLRIENAIFSAPTSLIKISGSLGGKPDKALSLLTYFKLDQQPLAEILEGLHLPSERMSGTLTLEGGLVLRGRNKKEIIRNLAGKLNLQITEGIVQKGNVVVKILDFLSIQNILLKRPPDILKNRFYFESIQGHATIENGVFATDHLFMKSPVFNAAARGRYDLPRNNLNFLIGVQPLNTIDRIVSKIPIIGHILTGNKKSILVYYFKIRGQPDQVIVKHIPFKNLDEAIVGYFKRLFLTPTRLLTKISDTLEEIGRDIRSGTTAPDPIDSSTIGP